MEPKMHELLTQRVRAALIRSAGLLLLLNGTAYANSLLEVYSEAKANNIELKSSLIDYKITQESRDEIAAEYDPNLSLNAKPTINLWNDSASNRLSLDYSLSFTKPIYQEQLNIRLSQAEMTIRREKILVASQQQQLVADVATAYLAFIAAQGKLAFTYLEQDLIRQSLRQINALYKDRLVTITDVTETQLQLNHSSFNVIVAKLALDSARKELQIITGRSFLALAPLQGNRPLPPVLPNQLSDWINLANKNSPELLLARLDSDIEKKNISIEKSSKSTSFDLFASYDGELGSKSVKSTSGGKFGLDINIPIYSGDQNLTKVRSAKLRHKKKQLVLELKKQEMAQDIQLAYLSAIASIDNVGVFRQAVVASQKNLRNIKHGKAAGTRTSADVLSSLKESFSVKQNYTEGKYKFLADLINLKLLAGVVSVDDLIEINNLLRKPQRPVVQASSMATEGSFSEAKSQGLNLEGAWGFN